MTSTAGRLARTIKSHHPSHSTLLQQNMNTFIPFTTFTDCARSLDSKRLNKQVSECGQILRAVLGYPVAAWSRHPCIRMWVGYDDALASYTMYCEAERQRRGMNPHLEADFVYELYDAPLQSQVELPHWWGRHDVHESHRVNLLLKRLGLPHGDYVWPV